MSILNHFKDFGPTTWAINNRTSVYIFTIILTMAGLFTFLNISKEQFPDIVVPTVIVSTVYPAGSNPQDIENLITKPIENQLKSTSGLRKVTSKSLPNVSLVTAEFNPDVPTAIAKQRVQDAADKSKNDLPSDLDNDPQVTEVNFSEFPIMQVNIAGDIPLPQLNIYAKELEERIEGLKQITRVDLIGGPKSEIQVNVDLFKMQSAGISLTDVERAISAQNVNISGGDLPVGDLRRTIRVSGQFENMQQIRNLVIRSTRGNQMYLFDIATVDSTFEEKQDFARLDGKSVISLNVIKRAGQNLIDASDEIQKICKEFKQKRLPPGVDIILTGDTAEQTNVQLNDLVNTVIIGFVLVLFVLMFFMGLRSAFFVALAVPLSALLAFLFMPSLGFTLNVIVVFSLLLALGIIVDDAIVVIENTHRIYQEDLNLDIKTAARAAAGEVFVPVLAGTLTTIAPFFPLLFWPGIVGEFMRYLPITLILTLFASLFVAFIMNPVFAVDTMHRDGHKSGWKKGLLVPAVIFLVLGILGHLGGNVIVGNLFLFLLVMTPINYFVFTPLSKLFQHRFWPTLIGGYSRLVTFLTKGWMPGVTIFATIALLFLSLVVFVASKPQINFFPQGEPNFAYVYVKFPVGTDARVTDKLTKEVEARIYEVIGRDNPNVKSVITNIGIGAGDPRDPDRVVSPYKAKITVAFKNFEERHGYQTSEVLNKIRERLRDVPGAEISVEKEPNGPPTGKPINVEIAGDDFDVMANIQDTLIRLIQKAGVKGIEDLRSDLVRNKPEIAIEIDPARAQAEGLSRAQIALEIRTALFGKEVSKFRGEEDDAPIMLRLDQSYRNQLEYLLNMNMSYLDMSTGMFRQVPISTFASINYTSTFTGINRKNYQRVVTLSSNVLEGFTANDIVREINGIIAGMQLPDGYQVKMTGEQEDQQETTDFLGVAFLGALLLMYLIMSTQFNSFVKPLIIFSTVFFSLIGVFFGYAISGQGFSIVMTGVGIFSLAGIVIRNGILLLEFTDELQRRGVPIREAVVQAGATRATPVFLTAICAILGLYPLAVGLNLNFATLLTHGDPHFFLGGDNVTFWGPLAWTMIYGLIVATFLTLLVVPCLLLVYLNLRARLFKALGIAREKDAVVAEEVQEDIRTDEAEG